MPDRSTPKILILDLVGLRPGPDGTPDTSEVEAHIAARGGVFHRGSGRAPGGRSEGGLAPSAGLQPGRPHFFYMPMLATEAEILAEAGDAFYDAAIVAATFIPAGAQFALGGVRIGAGTANMGSTSWGGGDGAGGGAPLMNTPGINARATAQMVMKALLRVRPDLPVAQLHQLVVAGQFDTGRDLVRFPTAKLEGQRLAVLGYGNIGREVAKLGRAFGMEVRLFARERHRDWIESEGFVWAPTILDAARDADALSVHLGLGARGATGFANAGAVGAEVLSALAPGAVLINYDRGELVDVAALRAALGSGRVGHAAIDADLFVDAGNGALSGPMQPYLALAARFGDRLSLLPHAAADTDHPTRVAGAKQAVDQILRAIGENVVHNLRGDLPEGMRSGTPIRPQGLGGLSASDLETFATSPAAQDLKAQAQAIVDALAGLENRTTAGAELMLACNRIATLLRQNGLEGPCQS